LSVEGSLPIPFQSSPTSHSFQTESTASDVESNRSSTTDLSDPEKVYLPFLDRFTAGASTSSSEITGLSVKEFIAAVLLGHYSKMLDNPYMTMPYYSVSETHRHLRCFNRTVKAYPTRHHERELNRKRDQKTCPYGCIIDGCHQHLSGTTYVPYMPFIFLLALVFYTTTSARSPQSALNIRNFSSVVPEMTLTEKDLDNIGRVFLWYR
jgi:hypothetical protein